MKEHKEVAVDPKLLHRYAGRYGEPPNLIITIRLEGSHLSLQENDEPKVEIFPEGENQFFSKMADDEVSFESDSQNRVTAMILRTGGRDIPIKRID